MRGWRALTIAGIDIEINYSWIFIFALLVLGMGAEFSIGVPDTPTWLAHLAGLVVAVLVFGCLLVHELAHSLTARAYGIGVARITLFLFGGVSQTRGEPASAASEVVIAAVGPVSSLALAGVFLGLGMGLNAVGAGQMAVMAANRLGAINGMLAVVNLLPAFPLDGGRLLRAALWEWWGDPLRSTRVATMLGRLMGGLLVAFGILEMFRLGFFGGVWFVALGWLLSGAAGQAYRSARVREALRHVPVYHAMQPLSAALAPDTSVFAAVHQHLMPRRLPAMPVADEGVISGLLTAEAVRQYPEAAWPHLRSGQVATPLDLEQMVLPVSANMAEALDRLVGGEQRYLIVVDPAGALVGLVSQESLGAAAQAYGRV